MLSVYIITAIVGGVFVLLSAFGGDHDSDTDHDVDHDVDHDFDHDVDHDFDHDVDHDFDHDVDHDFDHDVDHDFDHDHDVDHPLTHEAEGAVGEAAVWVPFFSMRFWTYFLTFFGATGLALTPFGVPGLVAGLLAGGMGITTGLGMAYGFRYLKKHTVQSGTGVYDFIGAEGRVLVTVSNRQVGKIRCRIKGKDTDLIATTDEEQPLHPGTRILILDLEGTTARIVQASYEQKKKEGEAAKEAGTKVKRG